MANDVDDHARTGATFAGRRGSERRQRLGGRVWLLRLAGLFGDRHRGRGSGSRGGTTWPGSRSGNGGGDDVQIVDEMIIRKAAGACAEGELTHGRREGCQEVGDDGDAVDGQIESAIRLYVDGDLNKITSAEEIQIVLCGEDRLSRTANIDRRSFAAGIVVGIE